ncbi:hypothetical protein B0T24DRAFT_607165 [Lasiosphaeria ovina]|uniref:MYND-type domain-containing protein n=1 Tax=Lasiosphaeria ovina TaxID=92902 RepID=A0AAE0NM51_9PEZI|nr:hypothetical protein B0T24DRAFT_607165 [Lasiosphaeria ovina]
MATAEIVVCALCNNPPTSPCPDCQELLYCSAACQANDAPVHRLVCAEFSALSLKKQSEETAGDGDDDGDDTEQNHVLGVLFPAGAHTATATATTTSSTAPTPPPPPPPALVRVHIGGFTDPDSGISFQEAEVAPFFAAASGPDDTAAAAVPEPLHTERNRVRNRDTRSMLEVWHVPAASGSSSRLALAKNACVPSLGSAGTGDAAGTAESNGTQLQQPGPFFEWRGPVLVLAMTRPTGFMVDPGAYRDCALQDYRDAVDFVLDYGNDLHARRTQEVLATLGAGAEAGGDDHRVTEVEEAEEPAEAAKTVVIEMQG